MSGVTPTSAEEFAGCLNDAAQSGHRIAVFGANSKRLMAGPLPVADVVFSTLRLNRVLQYEPNDLTISVEAGMRWADLQELLARRRQMVALDPPFWRQSTVGGVVASNVSGPLRQRFGTARDLVIGMQFAMLDGKLIRVGGMVVKNVAGLDIGKLMIGSFGTLAVITSLNLRLHPLPESTNTFLFSFGDLGSAIAKRDTLLGSLLRPLAMDVMAPAASARLGKRGYLLAVRAGGSRRVLARYARELSGGEHLTNGAGEFFWTQVSEFPAEFLRRQPGGLILRVSTPIQDVGNVLRLISGACISRAGSGVTYIYLTSWQAVRPLWQAAAQHGWSTVVEFAPDHIRSSRKLWLAPASQNDNTFAMMKSIKQMFDPDSLLNRSRLYGRL